MLEFFEVFGHMPGKEDVPGVAAIHHPLGHIDSGAGDVGSLVHIDHPANGSAVNAHPKLQCGCSFSARLISKAHCAGASGLV